MNEPPLPACLRRELIEIGDGTIFRRIHAARIPSEPGAYVLGVFLDRPTPAPQRFGGVLLAPGWYLYCGSARGPGGLRARLSRHMRRQKKARWHIDHLTTIAMSTVAVITQEHSECALVRRLLDGTDVETPIAGFGSTDCKTCTSHLLHWARFF